MSLQRNTRETLVDLWNGLVMMTVAVAATFIVASGFVWLGYALYSH
jgi:hypothetical protein